MNTRCAHGIRSRTLNEPQSIGHWIISTNSGVRSFFKNVFSSAGREARQDN